MGSCGHMFCNQCLYSYMETTPEKICPVCRQGLERSKFITLSSFKCSQQKSFQKYVHKDQTHQKDDKQGANIEKKSPLLSEKKNELDNISFTTKTHILLETCKKIRSTDPDAKTIIFSQWTTMLDLLQKPLDAAGYKYVRYDGSLSIAKREIALHKFRTEKTTTILLMSLKCGSLGLNLSVASHAVLVDIWWNPFLEDQAIDRIHRIGQTKQVEIHRLTIKNTIEDKILRLQDAKRRLVKTALGEGNYKIGRLSLSDLQQLFSS